jgi:hypothetical protein
MEWTDIIFFYFPILLGFLEILFYRKCVIDPKFPRITWFGLPVFAIPAFGAILAYIILFATIFLVSSEDIKVDENKKFVKKWLKS